MVKAKEVLFLSKAYTKKRGYKLNPDKKVVDNIIKSLINNEIKYGYRYCPCRVVTGNFSEDRQIICPCIYSELEVKEEGKCLCGLFVSKGKKVVAKKIKEGIVENTFVNRKLKQKAEKEKVCYMKVNKKTKYKARYKKKTYYFCSEACKKEFLEKPTDYLQKGFFW